MAFQRIAVLRVTALRSMSRDDSADLVRIWQALLDDPQRLASLAASGQAHQRRFYDWDVIARRYLELFGEVERARSQAPEAAT